MMISRRSLLQGLGVSLLAGPALAEDYFDLGQYWEVEEVSISSNIRFPGRWTRTGRATFAMEVRMSTTGEIIRDTIEFGSVRGNRITLHRRSLGEYHGIIAPDGVSIRGTATWYTPVDYWTARIVREVEGDVY